MSSNIPYDFHIFSSRDSLYEEVVQRFVSFLYFASRRERTVSIGLSGGKTPEKLFRRLGAHPLGKAIDWKRVHFFWCDERCVPADHPESNFGLFYRLVAKPLHVPDEQLHRIRGEAFPEEEAVRIEEELRNLFEGQNRKPALDWVFLGLGVDGHTASLFPQSPLLFERERLFAVAEHPESRQKRITMTPPLLNSGKKISFLVVGKSKCDVLARTIMAAGMDPDLPASFLQPQKSTIEWLLDYQAACRLLALSK